jgi:hypothetical protein
VLFVCCLIVVPLPPGENPFAVNNNNNNKNKIIIIKKIIIIIIIDGGKVVRPTRRPALYPQEHSKNIPGTHFC